MVFNKKKMGKRTRQEQSHELFIIMQNSEKMKNMLFFPCFLSYSTFLQALYVCCHKLNIDCLNDDDEKIFYSALTGENLVKDHIKLTEVKRVNDLNFILWLILMRIVRYLWRVKWKIWWHFPINRLSTLVCVRSMKFY